MEVELISRLERWLAVNRPDYLAQLQPGVTDRRLDAFEERFSVKLPALFRALYGWRNGQPNSYSAPLQYNQMLMPLEDIAETKDLLDGMIGSDFDDPRWWQGEAGCLLWRIMAVTTYASILLPRMVAIWDKSSLFGTIGKTAPRSILASRTGFRNW